MKKLFSLFVFTLCILSIKAQPGALDTAFNNNLGYLVNPGVINPVIVQPNGKILIGGAFPVNNSLGVLARLNQDGTIDPDFTLDSNYNYSLNCVALQNDGKILTGISINNHQCQVMRLDGNGSADFTFSTITLAGYYSANAIALQPNGKFLVGGDDTVIRFNGNGSPDTSFNYVPGINIGVIQSIIIQPDKKILLIGNGIARLDSSGNVDSTFNPALPFVCYTIALLPDTQIIAAGLNGIVRLNSDGSLDPTFNASHLLTLGGYIQSLAVAPDGKIIAGGVFVTTSTGNQTNIVRLNRDGSLDPTFNAGSQFALQVNSIAIQPDSNILAGGTNYCNICIPPHALARLYGGSPAITATINGRDTICKGDTTLMIAQATTDNGPITYNWQPAIGLSCATCDSVYASPDTTTTYTLIVQDSVNTDTVYLTVFVDSLRTPLTPTISISAIYADAYSGVYFCMNVVDSLAFEVSSSNGGKSPAYQWQINGQNIGVTSDTFSVVLDGSLVYTAQCAECLLTCQMTSSLGCVRPVVVSSDSVILGICSGINTTSIDNSVKIYPNPNNGAFLLSIDEPSQQLNIELLNIEGQIIYREQLKDVPSLSREFNFNYLAQGVYLLRITTENGISVKRFVMQ